MKKLFVVLTLTMLVSLPALAGDAGWKLVYEDDFESGSADRWDMTDDRAWKVRAEKDGGENQVLALARPSRYEPEVRSPKNIAWLKDFDSGSFRLDVRAKQTGREYGHRDLCFFFNKQDASHFYYVHLATVADAHANSIFLVDGAPRVSIAAERTDGTDWGQGWHDIRIEREEAGGSIKVYFDDMEKPVMVAGDKHFNSGTIGLGSFDDVGEFDDVKLYVKEEGKE